MPEPAANPATLFLAGDVERRKRRGRAGRAPRVLGIFTVSHGGAARG